MGKFRGALLLLALGISISTGQVRADEIIENCTQVTASGTDDTDSTPNNADFTKDPALFEDDESCVRITKVVPYDYGDAPDPTFPTTEANSGAKHLLGNDVYLGSCVDNDTGSLQGDATADDQNAGAYTFGTCDGTDDEDGVTFPELTIAATGLSLDVVSNTTCKLNAWIDWNGDGDWDDASEQVATDQDLVAGNNAVPLDVAISARAGDVYSRFRCSTLGGDTTTGEAADGEVEDYKVTIQLPEAGFTLEKYVQAAATAPAATANASDYDPGNANNILGDDAQSSADAVRINYNQAATYRIRIENTGGTWLNNVSVDDQMSACDPLTKIYESDATTATGVMSPGEVEVFECTLPAVISDVANIAKAWATPAYPPINPAAPEPTGQPEITPDDPAHVQTAGVASIRLKKYVQQSTDGAGNPVAAFDIATPATWGEDAQDGDSGVWITYGKDALYTLIVENTGETPLSNVQVDDEIQSCDPLTQVYDSDVSSDARPENVMAVGEIWAFQCSLANIQQTVTNIAEARGTPIEPLPTDLADPLQPTGQTPPVDIDPAVVMTQYNSAIDIKKYVMPAPDATATAIAEGDNTTYGNDAQDSASAQNIVFGETATFRIRVENTGTTWLDNVVVDEQIAACVLDQDIRVIDTDANTPNGVMSIGEVWWMECDLIAIQDNVVNTVTVKARPIQTPVDPNGPYEPSNQSEVNDNDPANVTTNSDPAILIEKYVQPATGASATITDAFTENWNATWGDDAQSNADAVSITYTESALYRIRVQNVGSTWLNSVVVDDQLTACDPLTKVEDSDNTTAAGIMSPNEIWWLECTQPDVVEPITNIATVTATPAKSPSDATDPLGNTGQPNISDDDPANIDTSADPRIELKKYVQPASTALGWNPADLSTLGDDAQDSQSAVGIDYNTDALYRITVTNTGATWLSTVVVDDLIDACTLSRIDDGDADANDLLSPNERWVYQCTLATVTDDTLANTATVSAQPVNPDGSTTNQSPVNDTDPAHIKTGSHSIGNMVWIDDGKGNATFANNGLLDNGEMLVPNGVQVELLNADGSVNLANTVTSNGFYLFDHLPAGQYTVCLPQSNFSAGNILAAYGPSTGGNEVNPNDDIDNNDNGEDDLQSGICSAVLDLADDEPTQETAANGNAAGQDGQGTSDLKSNLTVDFGVIPSYSLGNQVWIDDGAGTLASANNGQLDAGEGLAVQVALELLDASDAVVGNTTTSNGYYLFNNLTPADYKVRIAASNFAQGGVLEGFQSCTRGNEADANANGDGNDNGLDVDPTIAGVTTSTVTIGDNEPTLEQPTESGIAGNDGSNRLDSNSNLTVDLCVVKLTGIGNRLWLDESDPAARDATQINNAIFDTNEEPVANTQVHVFPEGVDPKTATPVATTQTDAQGCYHVNNLPEGRYFVHVPATEFANSKPLNNYTSSTNAGADNGADENTDENGVDTATPEADGISSIVYDLMAGQEAAAEPTCGANPTTLADNSIDDTADFGFVRANPAGVPVIALKKYVQAATGAPAYNAADDATLGQDAQTNNTAAFIPYDESALYRITVTNTGTVHLADVNPNDEVSDNIADCNLQRIDPVDARIVLAPSERWVYECSLANIQEDIINTADVSGTPIEPPVDSSDPAAAIIPTGQSPVRDSDNAHVDTGSYSIGNMVWIDDGKGNNTYANDGLRNHGEMVVPDNVTLELQDGAGAVLADTVTTDGYYLFSQLTAGDYKVCIKAENFTGAGLLASYVASTGGNETDPNLDVDNNDNGDDDTATNVCSGVITLADNEPTRESPTDNGQAGQDGQGTADNKSNLTIDFAVVPSYSLGNQIWVDDGAGTPANANNGKLDAGEVPVSNTVSLELLDANDNVVATTNPSNGFYLFEDLAPADYKVRIAASNFAASAALEGFQSCTRGNEADANSNRDGNDNGLDTDPVTGGITTSIITLGDNEPTLEQPTESGIAGNDGSSRPDINTNLTVDLCVVKLVGIGNRIWIDDSDPAARDGNQINNGIYDANEEPVANIAVEVFLAGANPTTDTPYAKTTTDAGGCYYFNGLAEGQYFVHLPAEEFANGNKLEGLISSTGAGADDGADENADENGQDGSTPNTDGISSIVYQLTAGTEPTGEPACGTNDTLLADNRIDDTADFGLVRAVAPATPSISIKKYVQPLTGAPAYDAANDVTLGQDAQTNDAEVSILYRETALYRITVTNTGGVHLTDVNPDDEIVDCNLQRIDPVDTRIVLAPNERWVYECTLDEIKQDVTNIAKVSGTPIEPPVDSTLDPADPALVLIPTGQTKPSDVDPAVITTAFGPSITLKKFVLDKATAIALVEGDTSTYGADAQDDRSAFNITYANDALYRIRVMNNGTTWLNNVVMSERLEACQKTDTSAGADKVIDTDPATPAGVMSVGEIWWFECTLPKVIEPVTNIADIKADPVHVPEDPANPPAVLEPTGQSPLYNTAPANVTTYIGPAIIIKKYVQPATNAQTFDAVDSATWGDDAQDSASAVNITYTEDALYRIKVQNVGETWLDQVVVDEQIAACNLLPIAGTTDSSDGFMNPNEIWWFECTLANITADVVNTATVDAVPTHDDKTTTEHAPINDTDPANIHTTADPRIELKKYVQIANGAPNWNSADLTTLGNDAQDSQNAVVIPYAGDALYRITVTNTGASWLDTVTVDDKIDACTLTRIDAGSGNDEVLNPNETWVYECTLTDITDETLANTATVEARPINEDGTSRDQSPVDSSDPAHIVTGSHSIGNLVWIDDGAGNAEYANNGIRDNGEQVVPNGVTLELQDSAGLALTETVTTDGYYLFSQLPANDYKVCVKEDNFAAGALLAAYQPSTGLSDTINLSISISSGQSVPTPVVASNGTGNAAFIIDRNTGAISGSFTVSGLTGAIQAAHIHTGATGATGAVIISLVTTANPNTWEIPAATVLDAAQLADLLAGNLYLNIHTAANASGEVRGQLNPTEAFDNNDNGEDDVTGGLCSEIITLNDFEPTAETPTDNGQAGEDGQGTADNQSNLSIDFAVIPSYSLGNQIWVDDGAGTLVNANNGQLDAGESPVSNTVQLELLDASDAVVATTTPNNGFYLFSGLTPADYKVRIAASNFGAGAVLEGFQSCTQGNETDANLNVDGNDNGLDTDPVTSGITTSTVTIGDNEPELEQPTESGIAGNDGSNRPDINTNLTVDLCVVKLVGIGNRIWIDESDPAARDNSQIDNGIYETNEEPASNVEVQVFPAGADPKTEAPYAITATDAEGCYHVNNLPEGQYFVHLPAEEFANGNKLEGLISSTGAGADDGADENADENGQDGSTPNTDGISSIVYQLTAGTEPTGEPACGTNDTLLADNRIDDTADFGLVRAVAPATPSISIKKYVQPLTGAPAYDAANDVTLGQDAQTNDAEVSTLYRETALYRITVTNTGGVHLTDVNPDDEIADCNLQRIDPVDTRIVLAPNERWVYECTLDEIKQDVTNIAKVSGTPIEPPVDSTLDPADPTLVLIPTGQTKPSDVDPAVITTAFGPSITLKKFVLDKVMVIALVEGDTSTYGADAQDDRSAFNITYANDALYRIRVMNNGTTWLNNVVVDERLEACENLTKVIDTDTATPAGVMSVGEVWWFECTLPKVIEPVTNIADVKADPVHVPEDPANPPAVLETTGQSPVYDTDPANVNTYIGPSIVIKKYVQPVTNAKVFNATDNTTWGEDAQDTASAVNIVYTEGALYRIRVHNTGETWLDQVVVDDQIAACDLQPIAGTTDSADGFMDPNEIWWFECTLSNITDDVMNLATVDAVPTHDDKTTTEHSPINDTDPANIHTTADPSIEIKKYVQDAEGASQWNILDDTTLGFDAQDSQHAVLIDYAGTAVYRIKVTNTGATWLDNVVVDDVIDSCDLQRTFQSIDAGEVLAPSEFWMYECALSDVRDELLANIATVEARPINEDGSSRDQSPVDDSDEAHIMTGSHSIGNLVWIDDGKGNATYANNGLNDHGEEVAPDGIKVELWNGDASQFLGETVTTDGYYLFHHLPAGEYKVCLPSANFSAGALLQAYGPSTGGNELDPNDNVDNNDNGDDTTQLGICSETLNLADDEPTSETPTDGGAAGQDGQGTDDNKSNLTVDFGLTLSYSLGNQIWIDDGAGLLTNANNGKLDAGELPVNDTVQLELLDAAGAVLSTTTPNAGFYLFSNLASADYIVRIAQSNFAQGGALEGFQSCTQGNEVDANEGRDGNDNGLDTDPRIDGISTSIVTLGDSEPTLEKPTADGVNGSDGSNRPDAYTNLSVDLCVVKLTGIGNRIWLDESNPNLRDVNEVNNAIFDDGELTVANAEVQLFPENADPDFDDYYDVTTTDRNGCYHFNNLPEGKYFVHIPAYQAVVTGDVVAALSAYVSSSGEGADNGIDDTQDENGKDDFDANSPGVSSIVFDLMANQEPVNERACGNNNSFLADDSIDDTADFGLVSDLSLGDRIWIDGNGNGVQDAEEHPLPGATVELLQDGNVIAQAVTNENGNYLFGQLTPDDYAVRVTPPSGYYPTLIFNDDPNTDSNLDSDCHAVADDTVVTTGIITLELGNEPVDDGDVLNPSSNLTIDCGFYRPVAVGNLIWEDLKEVDGILNNNEPSLDNMTVELTKEDGGAVTDVFGQSVSAVTTSNDGKYIFENLTPDAYIVEVTPPSLGYVLTVPSGDKPDENASDVDSNCLVNDAGSNTFSTPVFNLFNNTEPESTIDADDTDRDMTVDCGFYRPVSVGNIIWVDDDGNGIREPDEYLLSGAVVTLIDVDGNPAIDIFGNEVEPQETGEDGKYLFTNLSSGDYLLHVLPPEGYTPTDGVENPNDDYNFDSNCLAIDGDVTGAGLSQVITLLWGTEPVDDGDADFATNQTVGCGFKPNVFNIPTLSEWAYLLLIMLMIAVAWRMRSIKR